jgi:uncharacterized protein
MMPRKKCCRHISSAPESTWFKPAGIPMRELSEVVLGLDELESIRLADYMKLYHADAAVRMNISRQTFGRIVSEARQKIADALVHGKAIRIDGGHIHMNTKHKQDENSDSNEER